ncbi:hypothetical protein HK101_004736 [Irineochytrium annulatum]|nr:hypothetical protein HK101_004736 [Irineochytrium annulatum]
MVGALGGAVAAATGTAGGSQPVPESEEMTESNFTIADGDDGDEDEDTDHSGAIASPEPRRLSLRSLEELEEGRANPEVQVDEDERLPGVSDLVVALTIDDSPSIFSGEVLDILKELDCQATFFIIGDHAENLPDGEGDLILKRMVQEGHELGNHTWYDRPTIRLPTAIFEEELLKMDALIDRYSNMVDTSPSLVSAPSLPSPFASTSLSSTNPTTSTQAPNSNLITDASTTYNEPLPPRPTTSTELARKKRLKWFRPGQGWFSHEMCDLVERYGYKTVLGCRFPLDTASPDPKLNAWHVLSGIHPGAIVVLHDARERIKETLRILLPNLKRKGYRVVTISTLWMIAESGLVSGGHHAGSPGCGVVPHGTPLPASLRAMGRSMSVPPSGFTTPRSPLAQEDIEMGELTTGLPDTAILEVETE